jgi:hypothetical protein
MTSEVIREKKIYREHLENVATNATKDLILQRHQLFDDDIDELAIAMKSNTRLEALLLLGNRLQYSISTKL